MFILKVSLQHFNNSVEQVAKVYTSLMSTMRGTINDEADNEQNITEKNKKKSKHKIFLKALQVIVQQIIIPKSQYLIDHTLTS